MAARVTLKDVQIKLIMSLMQRLWTVETPIGGKEIGEMLSSEDIETELEFWEAAEEEERERLLLRDHSNWRREYCESMLSISRRNVGALKDVKVDLEEMQGLYGELKERILAWRDGRPVQLSQGPPGDSALNQEDRAARSPGPSATATHAVGQAEGVNRADSMDTVNRCVKVNKEMIEMEELRWKQVEEEMLSPVAKQVRLAEEKMGDIDRNIVMLLTLNHNIEEAIRQQEEMDIMRLGVAALRNLEDDSAESLGDLAVPLPETGATVTHAGQADWGERTVSTDVLNAFVKATMKMIEAEDLSLTHLEAEIHTLFEAFKDAKEKMGKSPQFVKRHVLQIRFAKEKQEDARSRTARLMKIKHFVEQSIRQREEVEIMRMNEKVLESLRVERGLNLEDSAVRLSSPMIPAAHEAAQAEREKRTASADVNWCIQANKNMIKKEELCLKRIEGELRALLKEHSDSRKAKVQNPLKSRLRAQKMRSAKQKMDNSKKRIAMLSQYNETMEQMTQPIKRMLMDYCAGKSLCADEVRAVLTEQNCSASLSEYLYGHNLVMVSLKCGHLTLTDGDWWFYNHLYVHAKNLHVGDAERPIFQRCLSEAKEAGLIDSKMAIDFGNVISSELRGGKEMLRAALFQVDRLSAQLTGSALFLSERMDRLEQHQDANMQLVSDHLDFKSQELDLLRSAFASYRKTRAVGHALRFGMHLLPVIGGAIAEGVSAAASAAELTKDLLSAGVGMVGEAGAIGGEKVFVRASLSLEQLKDQPHLHSELLKGLGISSFDGVQAMLKAGESDFNELGEVEVMAEVETVIGEISVLVGATEKLATAVEDVVELGSAEDVAELDKGEDVAGLDSVEDVTELDNVDNVTELGTGSKNGLRGASAAELSDFAALKERGITAEVVTKMNSEDLGELIAAYLINFRVEWSERFLDFRKSVTTVIEKLLICGELLVGKDRVIDGQEFVSLVQEQLESDNLQTPFTRKQLEKFVAKFMD